MSRDDLTKNNRYVEILKELVNAYIDTGEPVGSVTISQRIEQPLSPATIRNVMSDLEEQGFVCSTHTSSGRKPTEKGWRFFVNGLIESHNLSNISTSEKDKLRSVGTCSQNSSLESILERASGILSDLSKCASIIFLPAKNAPVRYVDFLPLSPGRAIIILVTSDGIVENRLIEIPLDVSNSVLEKAGKYLNTKLCGKTLPEIKMEIQNETNVYRDGIDELTRKIASTGIKILYDNDFGEKVIIKGQSNLIDNADEIVDLNKLLRLLDEKETMKEILDSSINGKGMQIFIGSKTDLFNLPGCSIVATSYRNPEEDVVGVIGVVGPSRMRYSRVITLVDYAAHVLSNLI